MEVAMLPEEQEQGEGAPVEGAEATRTADHLFQYSQFVHAGVGNDTAAEDCEHGEDGECKEEGHFHAWISLPNKLQNRDIEEKAKAAKARRKRALRDAGGDGRPASDAYVILESELDDLMSGDRVRVIEELAEREIRKAFGEYVLDVKEQERFETYEQDKEEYVRLAQLPDEDRDEEEFKRLDERMAEFAEAVDQRVTTERDRQIADMKQMGEEEVRGLVRNARIAGESNEASTVTYYIWLGFVCTKKVPKPGRASHQRYFDKLEDFRGAPPEAVDAIDKAIRDLEGRLSRGDAAGN